MRKFICLFSCFIALTSCATRQKPEVTYAHTNTDVLRGAALFALIDTGYIIKDATPKKITTELRRRGDVEWDIVAIIEDGRVKVDTSVSNPDGTVEKHVAKFMQNVGAHIERRQKINHEEELAQLGSKIEYFKAVNVRKAVANAEVCREIGPITSKTAQGWGLFGKDDFLISMRQELAALALIKGGNYVELETPMSGLLFLCETSQVANNSQFRI